MNTIAKEWAAFERMVLPPNAPPIQRKEMRRAFYAGAQALLKLQYQMDNVSEDAAMGLMSGWRDELVLFAKQVQRGEA